MSLDSRFPTRPLPDLLRWAQDEMRRRWLAGDTCGAEEYLDSLPDLASDPDRAVELILTEYRLRGELGRAPDPAEFLARFACWRERLEPRLSDLDPRANPTRSETITRTEGTVEGDSGEFPLGRHELLEEIGHGGMGIVFKARDTALDRLVALKMIRSGAWSGPEVERFHREAKAAAGLHHRHIVPVYAIGLFRGAPCYTMQLVSGGNLAQHLGRYRQDRPAAVALLEKVARAVHAAHEAGVIHRDLKPGNILLDDQGEPLVADFGLSKRSESEPDATATGQRLGTPAYMSPEQTRGEAKHVSAASDIWSMGVMLFELLTGRRPFEGREHDLARQVLESEPPRPRSLCRDLPRDLETVVLKCLRKEPAERYASAGEFADDLGRWLRGEPVRALRESWWRRLWRPIRRHPVRLGVGLLAVALAVTATVALWPADPDAPLKQQQERLARGEAVTLIGETGGPVRLRWLGTEAARIPSPNSDGSFTIHTLSVALLELLPDPRCERFVFRAEVRQIDDAGQGWVGLYAMHVRADRPYGIDDAVCNYVFAEFHPPTSWVHLRLQRFLDLPTTPGGNQMRQFPVPRVKTTTVTRNETTQWRRLALDVSPERVCVFWEGTKLYEVPRKEWRPRPFDFQDEQLTLPLPPEPSVRGGLGLFVYRATASFRRVVLEPQKVDATTPAAP